MLRQLLTLLAVLTGLTTAVAPAHALDARVQAVAMAQEMGAVSVQSETLVQGEAKALLKASCPVADADAQPLDCLPPPAILLKADRARE